MPKESGRPPKLVKESVRNIILEYLSKGNYIETACLAAGIRYQTFRNWQLWAQDYEANPGNGNEHRKIYFDFFQELKNAEAKAEAAALARIDEAGKQRQYWPANAFRLERKYPERWGRRDIPIVVESKVLIALRERAKAALAMPEVKQIESPK